MSLFVFVPTRKDFSWYAIPTNGLNPVLNFLMSPA